LGELIRNSDSIGCDARGAQAPRTPPWAPIVFWRGLWYKSYIGG